MKFTLETLTSFNDQIENSRKKLFKFIGKHKRDILLFSDDGNLKFFNSLNGKPVKISKSLDSNLKNISIVNISNDGENVIFVLQSGEILIWSYENDVIYSPESFILNSASILIKSIFLPNGIHFIVLISEANELFLWTNNTPDFYPSKSSKLCGSWAKIGHNCNYDFSINSLKDISYDVTYVNNSVWGEMCIISFSHFSKNVLNVLSAIIDLKLMNVVWTNNEIAEESFSNTQICKFSNSEPILIVGGKSKLLFINPIIGSQYFLDFPNNAKFVTDLCWICNDALVICVFADGKLAIATRCGFWAEIHGSGDEIYLLNVLENTHNSHCYKILPHHSQAEFVFTNSFSFACLKIIPEINCAIDLVGMILENQSTSTKKIRKKKKFKPKFKTKENELLHETKAVNSFTMLNFVPQYMNLSDLNCCFGLLNWNFEVWDDKMELFAENTIKKIVVILQEIPIDDNYEVGFNIIENNLFKLLNQLQFDVRHRLIGFSFQLVFGIVDYLISNKDEISVNQRIAFIHRITNLLTRSQSFVNNCYLMTEKYFCTEIKNPGIYFNHRFKRKWIDLYKLAKDLFFLNLKEENGNSVHLVSDVNDNFELENSKAMISSNNREVNLKEIDTHGLNEQCLRCKILIDNEENLENTSLNNYGNDLENDDIEKLKDVLTSIELELQLLNYNFKPRRKCHLDAGIRKLLTGHEKSGIIMWISYIQKILKNPLTEEHSNKERKTFTKRLYLLFYAVLSQKQYYTIQFHCKNSDRNIISRSPIFQREINNFFLTLSRFSASSLLQEPLRMPSFYKTQLSRSLLTLNPRLEFSSVEAENFLNCDSILMILILSGHLNEATWFSYVVGDWKLAVILSFTCAAIEKSLNTTKRKDLVSLPTWLSVEEMIYDRLIGIIDLDLTNFINNDQLVMTLHEHVVAGILCDVTIDLWQIIFDHMINEMSSLVKKFPLFIDEEFYLPAPPFFCPQDEIVVHGENAKIESQHRSNVSNLFDRLICLLISSNTLIQLAKNYSQSFENLPFQSEFYRYASLAHMSANLFPDSIKNFNILCKLMWILHCRDQLNITWRSFWKNISTTKKNCKLVKSCLLWAKNLKDEIENVESWEEDLNLLILTTIYEANAKKEIVDLFIECFSLDRTCPQELKFKWELICDYWKRAKVGNCSLFAYYSSQVNKRKECQNSSFPTMSKEMSDFLLIFFDISIHKKMENHIKYLEKIPSNKLNAEVIRERQLDSQKTWTDFQKLSKIEMIMELLPKKKLDDIKDKGQKTKRNKLENVNLKLTLPNNILFNVDKNVVPVLIWLDKWRKKNHFDGQLKKGHMKIDFKIETLLSILKVVSITEFVEDDKNLITTVALKTNELESESDKNTDEYSPEFEIPQQIEIEENQSDVTNYTPDEEPSHKNENEQDLIDTNQQNEENTQSNENCQGNNATMCNFDSNHEKQKISVGTNAPEPEQIEIPKFLRLSAEKETDTSSKFPPIVKPVITNSPDPRLRGGGPHPFPLLTMTEERITIKENTFCGHPVSQPVPHMGLPLLRLPQKFLQWQRPRVDPCHVCVEDNICSPNFYVQSMLKSYWSHVKQVRNQQLFSECLVEERERVIAWDDRENEVQNVVPKLSDSPDECRKLLKSDKKISRRRSDEKKKKLRLRSEVKRPVTRNELSFSSSPSPDCKSPPSPSSRSQNQYSKNEKLFKRRTLPGKCPPTGKCTSFRSPSPNSATSSLLSKGQRPPQRQESICTNETPQEAYYPLKRNFSPSSSQFYKTRENYNPRNEVKVCRSPSPEARDAFRNEVKICRNASSEARNYFRNEVKVCRSPSPEARNIFRNEVKICESQTPEARNAFRNEVKICRSPSPEARNTFRNEVKVCRSPSPEARNTFRNEVKVCRSPSPEARNILRNEVKICRSPSPSPEARSATTRDYNTTVGNCKKLISPMRKLLPTANIGSAAKCRQNYESTLKQRQFGVNAKERKNLTHNCTNVYSSETNSLFPSTITSTLQDSPDDIYSDEICSKIELQENDQQNFQTRGPLKSVSTMMSDGCVDESYSQFGVISQVNRVKSILREIQDYESETREIQTFEMKIKPEATQDIEEETNEGRSYTENATVCDQIYGKKFAEWKAKCTPKYKQKIPGVPPTVSHSRESPKSTVVKACFSGKSTLPPEIYRTREELSNIFLYGTIPRSSPKRAVKLDEKCMEEKRKAMELDDANEYLCKNNQYLNENHQTIGTTCDEDYGKFKREQKSSKPGKIEDYRNSFFAAPQTIKLHEERWKKRSVLVPKFPDIEELEEDDNVENTTLGNIKRETSGQDTPAQTFLDFQINRDEGNEFTDVPLKSWRENIKDPIIEERYDSTPTEIEVRKMATNQLKFKVEKFSSQLELLESISNQLTNDFENSREKLHDNDLATTPTNLSPDLSEIEHKSNDVSPRKCLSSLSKTNDKKDYLKSVNFKKRMKGACQLMKELILSQDLNTHSSVFQPQVINILTETEENLNKELNGLEITTTTSEDEGASSPKLKLSLGKKIKVDSTILEVNENNLSEVALKTPHLQQQKIHANEKNDKKLLKVKMTRAAKLRRELSKAKLNKLTATTKRTTQISTQKNNNSTPSTPSEWEIPIEVYNLLY